MHLLCDFRATSTCSCYCYCNNIQKPITCLKLHPIWSEASNETSPYTQVLFVTRMSHLLCESRMSVFDQATLLCQHQCNIVFELVHHFVQTFTKFGLRPTYFHSNMHMVFSWSLKVYFELKYQRQWSASSFFYMKYCCINPLYLFVFTKCAF